MPSGIEQGGRSQSDHAREKYGTHVPKMEQKVQCAKYGTKRVCRIKIVCCQKGTIAIVFGCYSNCVKYYVNRSYTVGVYLYIEVKGKPLLILENNFVLDILFWNSLLNQRLYGKAKKVI